MLVKIKIKRTDPNQGYYYKDYEVEAEKTTRVLDMLNDIARTQDPTLSFRMSCAHGVCGSDAMIINGKERLACKTLYQEIMDEADGAIDIRPLKHFPIERDLIVNQKKFMANYESVKPYFIIKQLPPHIKEFIQSPEDRALFDDATKCINCGACFSACPVLDKNPNFLGPQAIVQAARFIDDSRDQGMEDRLGVVDTPDGIWACESLFECTKVCPREIKITKVINFLKRKIKQYREANGQTVNDGSKA